MNRGIKIVDNPYLSALFPLFVRGDTKTEDFIPLLARRDLSRIISVSLTKINAASYLAFPDTEKFCCLP